MLNPLSETLYVRKQETMNKSKEKQQTAEKQTDLSGLQISKYKISPEYKIRMLTLTSRNERIKNVVKNKEI